MNIIPGEDRIVVRPLERQALAGTHETTQRGAVVAVGHRAPHEVGAQFIADIEDDHGVVLPSLVGDCVVFRPVNGDQFVVDGETYVSLRYDSVIATLREGDGR